MMKVLRAADHRIMPWKNGGGTTTEIAISPEHAGLDDFLWRVSMARVESAGPFSIFSGVDRSLLVVDGNGLDLTVQGRDPFRLVAGSQPLHFPADLPAQAELINGATTDLNVMSRRGKVHHSLRVLEVDTRSEALTAAPQALLFCMHGAVRVSHAAGEAILAPHDALLLDPAPTGITLSAEPAARLCLVEFRPAPVQAPAV